MNFVYLWNKPAVNQFCHHISKNGRQKYTHLSLEQMLINFSCFLLQSKLNTVHHEPARVASVCIALCLIHGPLLSADKPSIPGCRDGRCSSEPTSVRLWLRTTTLSIRTVRSVMDWCGLLGICFLWVCRSYVRGVRQGISIMDYGIKSSERYWKEAVSDYIDNLTRLDHLFYSEVADEVALLKWWLSAR